jgi:hypothetical protein
MLHRNILKVSTMFSALGRFILTVAVLVVTVYALSTKTKSGLPKLV